MLAAFAGASEGRADSDVLARCYPADSKARGLPAYVLTADRPLFGWNSRYYLWKYDQTAYSTRPFGVGVELASAPRIENGMLQLEEGSQDGDYIRIVSQGVLAGGTRIEIRLAEFPELATSGVLTDYLCDF